MELLTLERRATSIIAWITVLTGASQLAFPARLLPFLNVDPTAGAAQLFATVGMFMVLFGGAVLHAQAQRAALSVVLLWAGLQKIGAAVLVGWAVSRSVFAPLALLVAAFDFASGVLFFDLRRRGG
jgi:hypothetical protein